jgi:SAM-dependent methyltransferase
MNWKSHCVIVPAARKNRNGLRAELPRRDDMTIKSPLSPASTYHASDGAAYEIFLGRWTKLLAPLVLDFAAFPSQGDLLDLGTGTGSLARAMAARWPSRQILGIDIAEPYLAYARAQTERPPPQFKVGDAAALDHDDDAFAGVAAQLVLNFVPDASAAMREMRRVTRSGGTVVAAVWDFRGGLVYQRLFWDTAAGIDPGAADARDRLFSGSLAVPDGLPNLFNAAGLIDVRRSSLTIRMTYASFDDYWKPLLGGQGPVGTYITALDDGLRRRVEDAVRRAYYSGSPDGERSLTATAWAVRGTVP